ncbi:MAG: Tat pathway signal protein [Deltaproteobacteria bacterium]|nr:Tat pathway signal protein [Deltaproteobacteria bacterium]MBU52356.1 Tat pathway signal protein [Deltaproteobacteria bacterium]
MKNKNTSNDTKEDKQTPNKEEAKSSPSNKQKDTSKDKQKASKAEKDDEKDTEAVSETLPQEVVDARRRQFLKQAAVVTGITTVFGYASFAPPRWPMSLKDPDGERGKPKIALKKLPENGFASENKGNVMGIAHGKDLEAMVRGAIDAIGGIRRFIKKGDIVVIKPNVAFERPPALGATTNPELLKILIRVVKEGGAAEVRVADNPIEAPEQCFARSGIDRAVDVAKGRIYIPSHDDFRILNVPGAKLIEKWPFFWKPFIGATKVIGVAPVKDHNLCGASMTTKNWYGLLGGRRNQFHQDIHTIIADLALMMKPTFVLLDGSRVLFQSGPTGGSLDDVRDGNTIVASTDSLAADSFGWDELLRRKSQQRPGYLDKGAAMKLGNPNWKQVPHKRIQLG